MLRAVLCAFVLLSYVPTVRAETSPACPGESANQQLRRDFLTNHLNIETQRARRWTIGWTIGFSALAVGQFALVPVARSVEGPLLNRGMQPDLLLGGGSSLIGLATMFVTRLSILNDGPAFLADPCAPLSVGEAALERSAQTEKPSTSVLMHVANAALNIGRGLILGFAFDRWRTGIGSMLIGTTIGELKILTQPTGSIDALKRYRSGEFDEKQPAVTWEIVPDISGVSLAGTF